LGLALHRHEGDAGSRHEDEEVVMFVQVIEGRAADVDGMKRLMERWMDELKPGAEGYLGTTAGVAPNGHAVAVVRFESAAAAVANSDRPEQGEWWREMEACYEGEVAFFESDDVEIFLDGGSNDAGFVQVMKGHGIDRDVVARLDRVYEEHATSFRPDIIGGIRVWLGPDSGYDITYFTSEAEARKGESKEPPAALAELGPELEQIMANTEYIDLSDPWLF
jgi:hypothetical protein